MRFCKVSRADIDKTRVTLWLREADDGTLVGRVSTLALNEKGEVEMMSTEMADPPIYEAIALAVQLAEFKEEDVDVYDPDNLWKAEFGRLA